MSTCRKLHLTFLRALLTVPLLAVLTLVSAAAEPVRVRIMAANTSSGNLQSYPNPGPGVRIFQALAPDVVLIQEFNVTRAGANDRDVIDAWVDDVFGADYHWFREPGDESIPNGVISRFPIVESGEWRDPEVNNRDFAFARIDVPGERDLWAVSLHLLTRGAGVRNDEAQALARAIRQHPVPEDDFLVIGGDFNTDRRNESAVTTLGQLVDILGPFPDDGGSPPDGDTNRRRRKPYDWVLVDSDLQAFETATEVGDFTFPEGLVFDSRVFDQEDLDESFPPVRRDDSAAPQMQHMAVVRDFLLADDPTEPDAFFVAPTEVDFGTMAEAGAPFSDDSVRLTVTTPFSLTAVTFSGSHPGEFVLTDPDLSAGPVEINGDVRLTFTWTPELGEAGARQVTATLLAAADPGAAEITLRGAPRTAGAGEPFDLSGFRLEQTGGPASLVFPAGTRVEPGGIVVVGRAASQADFETFWGDLPAGVVYVNGASVVGDPGFPVINGGERYRLEDNGGDPVDPPTGQVPSTSVVRRHAHERDATDGETFVEQTDPRLRATPGRYGGIAAGTGRVVITEISDASEFQFEFVELLFDASSDDGARAVDAAFARAMNANDVDALVECYARDAILWGPAAPAAQGHEAIRASFTGLLETFTISDMAFVSTHYETLGDFSVGWGEFKMTMTPKSGGEPIASTGRYSVAARKEGGRWVYVMDHASMHPPPSVNMR